MPEPSHFSRLKLETRKSKLTTMMPSGEWLVLYDDYRKPMLQVSLDCEFKTEHESGAESYSRQMKSVALFGSSTLVVVRGKNLEIYQVSQSQ
jgi:hypothetical protein